MHINEAVQKRILEICDERDISIYKLAQVSCITQSTLNSLLNRNNSKTSIGTISKICNGLEISLADFFTSELFDSIEDEL